MACGPPKPNCDAIVRAAAACCRGRIRSPVLRPVRRTVLRGAIRPGGLGWSRRRTLLGGIRPAVLRRIRRFRGCDGFAGAGLATDSTSHSAFAWHLACCFAIWKNRPAAERSGCLHPNPWNRSATRPAARTAAPPRPELVLVAVSSHPPVAPDEPDRYGTTMVSRGSTMMFCDMFWPLITCL